MKTTRTTKTCNCSVSLPRCAKKLVMKLVVTRELIMAAERPTSRTLTTFMQILRMLHVIKSKEERQEYDKNLLFFKDVDDG